MHRFDLLDAMKRIERSYVDVLTSYGPGVVWPPDAAYELAGYAKDLVAAAEELAAHYRDMERVWLRTAEEGGSGGP